MTGAVALELIEAQMCAHYHKTPEEMDALADWPRAFRAWYILHYDPEKDT